METTDSQDRTLLYCPDCRKPTYTYVGYGDVAVWCRHCKSAFEVLIKLPDRSDKTIKRSGQEREAEGGN